MQRKTFIIITHHPQHVVKKRLEAKSITQLPCEYRGQKFHLPQDLHQLFTAFHVSFGSTKVTATTLPPKLDSIFVYPVELFTDSEFKLRNQVELGSKKSLNAERHIKEVEITSSATSDQPEYSQNPNSNENLLKQLEQLKGANLQLQQAIQEVQTSQSEWLNVQKQQFEQKLKDSQHAQLEEFENRMKDLRKHYDNSQQTQLANFEKRLQELRTQHAEQVTSYMRRPENILEKISISSDSSNPQRLPKTASRIMGLDRNVKITPESLQHMYFQGCKFYHPAHCSTPGLSYFSNKQYTIWTQSYEALYNFLSRDALRKETIILSHSKGKEEEDNSPQGWKAY